MKYDPDEAVRITSATAMFEHDSYIFKVHNSEGNFCVVLEKHEYARGFFEASAKCCKHIDDPCTAHSNDLKDAIRQSIELHKQLAHR